MNKNPMVTVLLMNFKRKRNLPIIIDSLKSQTVGCNIFLWNNADEAYVDDRLDLIINSSKNLRCWPRWSMAAHSETEYIMTHDDDLCFTSENSLEELIKCHQKHEKPGLAVGFNGVKLGSDFSYYPSKGQKIIRKIGVTVGAKHVKFPKIDTPVDIVKGRMIFCKTEDLKQLPTRVDCDDCDDIVVSSHLSCGMIGHHMITSKLNHSIKELSGGKESMAISNRPDWEELRTSLAKKYFLIQ